MEVSPTIFRAYDIRGVYPSEINEDVAHHIGKAAGTFLMRRGISNCVLGRDNRESSPALCVAFIEGIKSTGCDVTYVDITTSPMIYFLTSKQDFGAGVNVTASHNPKQFNGFRFCYGNAVSFSGEEVASLYDLIIHEDYEVGEGTVEEKDLSSLYIDYMKENFHFSKKFKVAVNCGNGATSIIAPAVFEALGCEVVPINCVYDSNFPHGIPNPQNEIFMKHLSETVLKSGADAGFAFDTDGDRFDAVAEDGVAYGIEKLLLLLSEDILKEKSGGTIIFDVKASALIEDYIKSLGGVPKMLRTGHGFFIEELKKGAVFGCEFSGHAYFNDKDFGYDDGLYAAVRVLEVLDKQNAKFSDLMKKYPSRVSSPELKVGCPDGKKFEVIEDMVEKALANERYKKVTTIDGIRVSVTDTGWFLIRASNTSPYLSIRVEGVNDAEKDAMLDEVDKVLAEYDFLEEKQLL